MRRTFVGMEQSVIQSAYRTRWVGDQLQPTMLDSATGATFQGLLVGTLPVLARISFF
ncbi:hypothetical protein FVEN_g12856 [Fusarium venenatum]|nr:hypothetical protein FVEN_g12856 [Fusarium venenatum]